jgi:hypothetical protein
LEVVVMSGELPAIAPSSEELAGVELAARAGVWIEEIQIDRLDDHRMLKAHLTEIGWQGKQRGRYGR